MIVNSFRLNRYYVIFDCTSLAKLGLFCWHRMSYCLSTVALLQQNCARYAKQPYNVDKNLQVVSTQRTEKVERRVIVVNGHQRNAALHFKMTLEKIAKSGLLIKIRGTT